MAEYGEWTYVRLTGERGADGETSPRLEVTAVSPAVISIDRRTSNYPTVSVDIVAHNWPEDQEYIVTIDGVEIYPNDDEERAIDSANFNYTYESYPTGNYITVNIRCEALGMNFDRDIPIDDATESNMDFGLLATLPSNAMTGDVFIPTQNIELEDETVIHALQPCLYNGETWVEMTQSPQSNQIIVKHIAEITSSMAGSEIPDTAVVYKAFVNSLFAQDVVTENLTVGKSSTLLGSIDTHIIKSKEGSGAEIIKYEPSEDTPPHFDTNFLYDNAYLVVPRHNKWEVTWMTYPEGETVTLPIEEGVGTFIDVLQLWYFRGFGPGGNVEVARSSAIKQFPTYFGQGGQTLTFGGGVGGWGGDIEGHFPVSTLNFVLSNYVVSGETFFSPRTEWTVKVKRDGTVLGQKTGVFARKIGTTSPNTTLQINDVAIWPTDEIEVTLNPLEPIGSTTVLTRAMVAMVAKPISWEDWMYEVGQPLAIDAFFTIMDEDPRVSRDASILSATPIRRPYATLSRGSYLYQIKEYDADTDELLNTWGPIWTWDTWNADARNIFPQTGEYRGVDRVDFEIESWDDEYKAYGPVFGGDVVWTRDKLSIYDSDGDVVAETFPMAYYKTLTMSFSFQDEADQCFLRTPTPFPDDQVKSIGTPTNHWSVAYIDTLIGSVEGTITDARDATYATKIGKFEHTSQIGSPSKPVYIASDGTVTAGNSIPDTSTLATKTELSNGLATKADINHTEGIYTRVIDKDEMTYEANHTKSTQSYSRLAVEYDSTSSSLGNDKRIQMSVANGIQYGERAYGSTGSYTLNAWEISPSGVFDGHLKEVENIDNVSWMSETDILNYLNNN